LAHPKLLNLKAKLRKSLLPQVSSADSAEDPEKSVFEVVGNATPKLR